MLNYIGIMSGGLAVAYGMKSAINWAADKQIMKKQRAAQRHLKAQPQKREILRSDQKKIA